MQDKEISLPVPFDYTPPFLHIRLDAASNDVIFLFVCLPHAVTWQDTVLEVGKDSAAEERTVSLTPTSLCQKTRGRRGTTGCKMMMYS